MQFKKDRIRLIDNKTQKKFKLDGYSLDLDLYKTRIDLVIGQEKQVNRFYGDDGCNGFVHPTDDEYCYLLWIKNKNGSTLVHELYHIVNKIGKKVGLSEDRENEAQAYLIGWLFEEIKKLK